MPRTRRRRRAPLQVSAGGRHRENGRHLRVIGGGPIRQRGWAERAEGRLLELEKLAVLEGSAKRAELVCYLLVVM